jgi:TRAP-type mannitol/chloroaromatic compound transport system substrate-binding protein
MNTTRRRLVSATLAATMAAPAIARAATIRRWRCATSWPRNMAGPGVTAQRLARRIEVMSQGELVIEMFGAGDIVPALGVFDAVSTGTVEMGHTAALFWQGKMAAAPIFTTVPFGLGPTGHAAWIDRGGQGLWDALYERSGVRGLLAGNTGPSSAGWFRREIKGLQDLKGLRIRATGLGGELYQKLGATAIVTAPADTYPALERGVIDAAEFLAPANDAPLGLQRVAPFLAFPGFNKPNGGSEALIGLKSWHELPPHLKAIVEAACRAEHDQALAEAEAANGEALNTLLGAGAQLMTLPDDVLDAARLAAGELLARISGTDALSSQIVASYRAALEAGKAWRRVRAISQYRLL